MTRLTGMTFSRDRIAMTVLLLSLLCHLLSSVNTQSSQVVPNASPQVTIKDGSVFQGNSYSIRGNEIDEFVGIPFARPPVGQLRFSKPQQLDVMQGVYLATSFKPACSQPDPHIKHSEDCLYLNIWRPSSRKISTRSRLPVFHFIHGGGFIYGSASEPIFNGSAWPALKDVILVTQNYRMSLFGFFHGNNSEQPGNLAFWDHAAALTWVQDNIEFFGGDPSRVTLFGQSAGSCSVGAHITSPITSKMFYRAIMMSGSPYVTMSPKTNIEESMKIAQTLRCPVVPGDTSWIDCMKSKPVGSILNTVISSQFNFGPNAGDDIYPIAALPALRSGFYNSKIEIMNGLMEEEGSYVLFNYCEGIPGFERSKPAIVTKAAAMECIRRSIYHPKVKEIAAEYYTANISDNDSNRLRLAASKAAGDFMFTCPTHFFGQEFAKNNIQSKNVYSYHVTYKSKFSYFCWGSDWTGVCHADELFMLFGDPIRRPWMYNFTDITFSEQLIHDFTTFGISGKPPNQGLTAWPAYQSASGSIFHFSSSQDESVHQPVNTEINDFAQILQENNVLSLPNNEKPRARISSKPLNSRRQHERKIRPNYMELNAYKMGNVVFDPYQDCSQLWKNHLYVWSSSEVEVMMSNRRLPPPESRFRAEFFA